MKTTKEVISKKKRLLVYETLIRIYEMHSNPNKLTVQLEVNGKRYRRAFPEGGMCYNIKELNHILELGIPNEGYGIYEADGITQSGLEYFFPELKKFKPKKYMAYWFYNQEERIEALQYAIKLLKKK